ncbi:MAG: M18 family aminopeptidase [Clostridia bacterium]|nr:M18 family aminopeptidase [Clostridia bacterium]
MSNRANGFLDFISRSPSQFHAVNEICKVLEDKGFAKLNERDQWTIVPGGRYYVTRNLSSVIAFTIPECGMSHFQVVASHSDSPTFKLKPVAEDIALGKYVRLNTEIYGGPINSTWVDRPLSIAGRVLVKEGSSISVKLVNLDRDTVLIPNMPIHFNREANDGFKYNPQIDLMPLYGEGNEKGQLVKDLAASCGVEAESIVGGDLYLYSRTHGSIWGANNEFFSCGRIDDLECAWTSLQAFVEVEKANHINVLAVFDNEETGSRSRQGADSTLMEDVFARVGAALGATDAQIRAAVVSSFMVSADNAHGVHPNHPEKYDAGNRTYMNQGVVIKSNANQSYTSDAISSSIFKTICENAGVPVQLFSNRSDTRGGGTLGNIALSHASMSSVDIGLPQLAMHSAYETAGVKDVDYMIDALRAFYSTSIVVECDGAYTLAD